MSPLLAVEGLSVSFRPRRGPVVAAVRDLSFELFAGETLALVGGSGSGKSVTALALMRLIERERGVIDAGAMPFEAPSGPVDLARLPEPEMRRLRGAALSMVFQEPMTALNPVLTVGDQLTEPLILHRALAPDDARSEARALLDRVRLTDPTRRLDQHPHELSGGMRQRVMIAMALACRPRLLIADEPTTALDVTTQAQILELIRELREETGAAVLFITHDMGVVAEIADRVVVMRDGRRMETAPVRDLFAAPKADYTRRLLAAAPRLGSGAPEPAPAPPPLLDVRKLSVRFPVRRGAFGRFAGRLHAVEDVSFTLAEGETLGLVGESGSGKSTLGRAVLKLIEPSAGEIRLDGIDLAALDRKAMRPFRRHLQMVFQDPYASLNPRLGILDSLTEPLVLHTRLSEAERRARAADLLRRVSLPPEALDRWPHQFSGGQRQRLCIARALAAHPRLIVADEAVSALDVSVQAQVMDLMREIQAEDGLAWLFISHDLAVVERMSHRVAVMMEGRIVETGPTAEVLSRPAHAYTRALLEAAPVPDPDRRRVRALRDARERRSPVHPPDWRAPAHHWREVAPGHLVLEPA